MATNDYKLKNGLTVICLFFLLFPQILKSQENAHDYNESGVVKHNKGQYEEAIKDYDKSLELKPDGVVYSNRGLAKLELKNYEYAMKDFNKAIELIPTNAYYYFNRGKANHFLANYEAAVKDYDKAIDLNPTTAIYYEDRSNAKSMLGRYEDAIKDCDKAIDLNPKIANYFFLRGLSKRYLGKYKEAIKDFEQALVLDTKLNNIYYQLGKCSYKLNNSVKANEYFSKYILQAADSSLVSFAKLYLGQKDIAFEEMNGIVKRAPNKQNFYNLAKFYAITGETDNAIKSLDIALAKGWNLYSYMQMDDDFDYIHYKSEYIALLKKYNITNINPDIPLSKIITSEVKLAITKWQEKGEFEITAAYIERMKTREEEVKRATQEVTNRLKNDFLQKINWSNTQIGRYDPDGQSFMLTIEGFKGVVINVPLADAAMFKQNFQTYKIVKKDLVISNDEWAISDLVLTDLTGIKKYQYDIKNQPDYNPNKIFTLNFAALDIKVNVNQYDNSKFQKSEETQPIVVGLSEVDTNIPTYKTINPHTYALIIGNEDYSSFQSGLSSEVNVVFAVNDATIFKKYCINIFGVPESNVKFYTNATSGQMNQSIAWINKIIQKEGGEAEVVVYYAGHGLPDEQTHEPYIIPVDVSGSDLQSAIKLQTLYSKLTEYPSKKITVFMDACFSGGSRGQGLLTSRGVKVKPKDELLTGNIVVFTSSSGEQSSLPFKDKQHGMFTYYLLKKMQETKGSVSYEELYSYVKKEVDLNCVKVNNKEQTPGLLFSTELGDHWKGWKLR